MRELAATLGVNRNTVSLAYQRLVTAGIAVTQGRLGTAIRAQRDPGEQEGLLPGSPLADLGGGNPNLAWLPDVGAALARKPYRPRLYGEATVDPELEVLARRWMAGDCPEQHEITLTNGAVDAVERLLGRTWPRATRWPWKTRASSAASTPCASPACTPLAWRSMPRACRRRRWNGR